MPCPSPNFKNMASLTTEVDAVNTILQVAGESQVASGTDLTSASLPYEVQAAYDILTETAREMCLTSYVFNTEGDVTLTPNGDNKIDVDDGSNPYVQVRNQSTKEVYVTRNGFLYSMKDRTSTFTSSIEATIVYLLNFLDLPETAKRYCIVRAARIFADRLVGSKDIRAFTERDEMEARAQLADYQYGVDNINMLRDNQDTWSIVDRSANSGPSWL